MFGVFLAVGKIHLIWLRTTKSELSTWGTFTVNNNKKGPSIQWFTWSFLDTYLRMKWMGSPAESRLTGDAPLNRSHQCTLITSQTILTGWKQPAAAGSVLFPAQHWWGHIWNTFWHNQYKRDVGTGVGPLESYQAAYLENMTYKESGGRWTCSVWHRGV